MKKILIPFVLALVATLLFVPKAEATSPPPAFVTEAGLMECDISSQFFSDWSVYDNVSYSCKVTNDKIGNQWFDLYRYSSADVAAAQAVWLDVFGDFASADYFTRDGRFLIMPMGTANTYPTTEFWAGYAAAKTGGSVKVG